MALSKEVFEKAKELFGHAIDTHSKEIDTAYYNVDGKLNVTFKIGIEPDVAGEKVGCGISFVKEKVTNVFSDIVEKQDVILDELED